MGGDSTKTNFGGKAGPNPALTQQTPNLFQAAQRHMPAEYFGNKPINDPTAILNAYMQNLPAFLASTKSQNSVVPKATTTPNVTAPIRRTNLNTGKGGALRNLFTVMSGQGTPETIEQVSSFLITRVLNLVVARISLSS